MKWCISISSKIVWTFGISTVVVVVLSILGTWHQKDSAKNSSKLNKFLHSEVNLLIQHITSAISRLRNMYISIYVNENSIIFIMYLLVHSLNWWRLLRGWNILFFLKYVYNISLLIRKNGLFCSFFYDNHTSVPFFSNSINIQVNIAKKWRF